MDTERARFIRYVSPDEPMHDLVRQAKSLTYEHYCEHALVELADGHWVLVCGGQYSIEFERDTRLDAYGRPIDELYVDIEGQRVRVVRLVFHTHPKPTGPSDADLLVLALLGQQQSMLYELFGPRDGTLIHPK